MICNLLYSGKGGRGAAAHLHLKRHALVKRVSEHLKMPILSAGITYITYCKKEHNMSPLSKTESHQILYQGSSNLSQEGQSAIC